MDESTNDMTTPQQPTPAQAGQPVAPAVPLPATASSAEKGKCVRNYVLAGVSGVVGAVLVLGAGVIGYSIGTHDGRSHHEATFTMSADRNGQPGDQQGREPGNDPMMGGREDGPAFGERYGQQDDQPGGPMMGGQQGKGPMMQGPGGGIQDFLNQLQGGQGLTSDQQQFLDQLKGFIGGMRDQAG